MEYLLLCVFRAQFAEMEHERMEPSSEEDSEESDTSEFVQLVYDIRNQSYDSLAGTNFNDQ